MYVCFIAVSSYCNMKCEVGVVILYRSSYGRKLSSVYLLCLNFVVRVLDQIKCKKMMSKQIDTYE